MDHMTRGMGKATIKAAAELKTKHSFTSAGDEASAEAPRWRRAERCPRPGWGWTLCEGGASGSWKCRRSGWSCFGEGWPSTARRPGPGGWAWRRGWAAAMWKKEAGILRETGSGRELRPSAGRWTSWPGRTRAVLKIPASLWRGSVETSYHYWIKILFWIFL